MLIDSLIEAVGPEYVSESPEATELASQDVYRGGERPLAVVRPGSTGEVQAVMRACGAARTAVFVRGGGMSYTDAFLPDRRESIILDTGRLTAIREINARDLYATVEAGCTWSQIDEALAEQGLRPVFWGPMSGRISTVGGAMAQGAVTFGSGRNGPSVSAALGLEVVLADGSLLVTGSGGQPGHTAFFREYGPDLTGLFCGDAGALGVKTAVTLRLEPRPGAGQGVTFSFSGFPALVEAVEAVSRFGLVTEVFGAETELVRLNAGPTVLKQDLAKFLDIMRGASNPFEAIRKGVRAAFGGRGFLNASRYLLNFLAEGADSRELNATLRRIRRAVGDQGTEVASTMAEFARAVPFPDPMVLGPGGLRLLPLHAIVPYTRTMALHDEVEGYLERMRDECADKRVMVYLVYSTSGRAGFLYENVIYWEDEWLAYHRHYLPAEMRDAFKESRPNPDGRALVERIRVDLIDIMYKHGSTHLQIGRAYPYARDRNPASLQLLRSIKQQVDPSGLINPGALGI